MSFFFPTVQPLPSNVTVTVVGMDSPAASNSDDDGWSTLTPQDEEADEASIVVHAPETEDEKEDVASVNSDSTDKQASEVDNAPKAERSADELETPRTPTNLKQRSALTETKKKCEPLARKAARETDRIAAALSQKMSLRYSNYRKSNPTPEQILAKCERYRDEAHRLYKRFDREVYAVWKNLDNEEYAKWEKFDQQNRAKRIHNNKVYLEAERRHRKNQTVTIYSEWKKIESKEAARSAELRNQSTEAWKVYKKISNDGWTKYKLKKKDARNR